MEIGKLTPEERANKILDALSFIAPEDHAMKFGKVLGHVLKAIAQEREECAKVAESELCCCKTEDQHDGCCSNCGKRIGAVIRAR